MEEADTANGAGLLPSLSVSRRRDRRRNNRLPPSLTKPDTPRSPRC